MKSNNDSLDRERFYEITAVEEGDCWYEKPGSDYCICGAIVRPTAQSGQFTVIKACPNGYFSASIDEPLFFGSDGQITLRPLSKKDQGKLERIRNQYA